MTQFFANQTKIKRFRHLKTSIAGLSCLTLFVVLAAPVHSAATLWSDAFAKGDDALASNQPNLAVANFRNALNLAKKQSKNKTDWDNCSLKLAMSLTLVGKVAEARSMLQNLLNSASKTDGSKSPRLRPILMKLGAIEESAGNHTVAMGYYKRALQITEENYGPYSPEAAYALHGLGRTNKATGNIDAASSSYQRAISILSKDPNLEAAEELKKIMSEGADLIKRDDDSNKDLLKDFQRDILNNDGAKKEPPSSSSGSQFQQESSFKLKAQHQDNTGEDEKIALRGLPLSSATSLSPAFKVLNETLVDQSRYKIGEEQYQRMIATDMNSLGPNHPSLANDLRGLAQVYIAQRRYQDAEPLLQKALAIYESAYGAKNAVSIGTGTTLALAEAELGKREQAIALYNKLLSNAQEAFGPGSIETAKILNGLAYLYYQQGQFSKSSTMYEWALASTQQAVGEKDPLLAACLRDYAQVLRRLDQSSKANELELRAGQITGQ